MKVKRKIEVETDKYRVGDIISFELIDGEKIRARAVKQEEDGMLFCAIDCLKDEYPMNKNGSNEGGYKESDLRKWLNAEILDKFPQKIREHMQPMEYGDLLRIPTEQEIFGENKYGEADSAEQWLCMKKRRNRMALCEEELCWYWLQNRYPENAYRFCTVYGVGSASTNSAGHSYCIRPVFLLSYRYGAKEAEK
jgi:hypothetical protein